jgi:hypothetical protein
MLPRILLLIIATIANKNSLGNDYFGDAGFESDGTTKVTGPALLLLLL